MSKEQYNIVWLRRDLRLYDQAAFASAMKAQGKILPIFIFDKEILARFKNPKDRRLSFIMRALKHMHVELKKHGSGIAAFYGTPADIWKSLSSTLDIREVFADQDYEPDTRLRDQAVQHTLSSNSKLTLLKDHLIFAPGEITSQSGAPFKVFTPFSKAWLEKFTPADMGEFELKNWDMLANLGDVHEQLQGQKIEQIDLDNELDVLLESIGYEYVEDERWPVENAPAILEKFTANKVQNYKNMRDMVAEHGTSELSPYLRFGLVSIRDCMRKAHAAGGAEKWISELIWREFYAMILFHTPESMHTEWNEKYREKLDWSHNEKHFQAWCEGKTGYPIVDAAMRELTTTGWMHNRARMIVASFLTKDLHIDWRKGEEFFAQYLMDYELASNVGGWQWAASTGTDAQLYFRIFNPILQSKKFDTEGKYIRHYVPELREVKGAAIHEPWTLEQNLDYPARIVDHSESRAKALSMFKQAESASE